VQKSNTATAASARGGNAGNDGATQKSVKRAAPAPKVKVKTRR
jgi:hypothetical protein